jgi:hypothetical protein
MQAGRWILWQLLLYALVCIDLLGLGNVDLAGMVDTTIGSCLASIVVGLVNDALNVL